MLIDWFTVVAQAANFLILVWLLKRFLYAPILNALDAREKRIAAELAAAATKQAEAEAERAEYKRNSEALESRRAEILRQATAEADALRGQLMAKARSDAESLKAKNQKQLDDEYRAITREIARRTQASVLAIVRKTLTDLAGSDLEERMVEVFIRRLQAMGQEEIQQLSVVSETVLVRSAFELPPPLRAKIEEAVGKFSAAKISYEVLAELVSGIELIAHGQKIAWSVSDYLGMLDREVSALLKSDKEERDEPAVGI